MPRRYTTKAGKIAEKILTKELKDRLDAGVEPKVAYEEVGEKYELTPQHIQTYIPIKVLKDV